MTAARQERKSWRLWAAMATILAAAALPAGLGLAPASLRAATTERVVTNRYTGLALDGFDPVAYFVDAAPRFGRVELEFRYAGATWRFVNQGNRAAFMANPDIYMPRFGGYDAIAVARGTGTPGHPKLWRIADQRLYLFYSEEARSAFIQNPEGVIEAAERHWPEVLLTLSP
jgi:YHS domain-containing protein